MPTQAIIDALMMMKRAFTPTPTSTPASTALGVDEARALQRRKATEWANLPETRRRFPNMKPEDVESNYLVFGPSDAPASPQRPRPAPTPTPPRPDPNRPTQIPRTPEELEAQAKEEAARRRREEEARRRREEEGL